MAEDRRDDETEDGAGSPSTDADEARGVAAREKEALEAEQTEGERGSEDAELDDAPTEPLPDVAATGGADASTASEGSSDGDPSAETGSGARESDAAEDAPPHAELEPSAREQASDANQADGGGSNPRLHYAAWGKPFATVDRVWTRFEMRLCAFVLGLEIFSLTLWVVLKGLSSRTSDETTSNAGVVFRGVVGAIVLGCLAYYALKKVGGVWQRVGGVLGIAIGLGTGKLWADVGVDWSSNLLNWYQQASTLTLLGGLRGIGTRLTLLLALLGGSLATAAGKHITIDVVTRLVKPVVRKWLLIVGWVGTAGICYAASWGFFDHVAIEAYGSDATATAGEKIEAVGEGLGERWFILRKQIGLDFKTLPHVMAGEPYAEWFTGAEYNQWVRENGFAERFGEEAAKNLEIPPDAKRSPIIVVPGKGEPRGELVDAANLVFPIGLFIIATRFLLLCVLVISGHKSWEPEEDETFKSNEGGQNEGSSDSDSSSSGSADADNEEATSGAEPDPPAAAPDDPESDKQSAAERGEREAA